MTAGGVFRAKTPRCTRVAPNAPVLGGLQHDGGCGKRRGSIQGSREWAAGGPVVVDLVVVAEEEEEEVVVVVEQAAVIGEGGGVDVVVETRRSYRSVAPTYPNYSSRPGSQPGSAPQQPGPAQPSPAQPSPACALRTFAGKRCFRTSLVRSGPGLFDGSSNEVTVCLLPRPFSWPIQSSPSPLRSLLLTS